MTDVQQQQKQKLICTTESKSINNMVWCIYFNQIIPYDIRIIGKCSVAICGLLSVVYRLTVVCCSSVVRTVNAVNNTAYTALCVMCSGARVCDRSVRASNQQRLLSRHRPSGASHK